MLLDTTVQMKHCNCLWTDVSIQIAQSTLKIPNISN